MNQTVTLPCVDGTERTVPVLSIDEVITLEHRIAAEGTSLYELMQRAGYALAKAVQGSIESPRSIVVLAGSGNNGGDGWVAAQILAEAGYPVTLVSKTVPEEIAVEPARTATLEAALHGSFDIAIDPDETQLWGLLQSTDLIIDAILGTGFAHSEVRSPYAEWIEAANIAQEKGHILIISADCPSGLNAQTGSSANRYITADVTVTMLAPKYGFLSPHAHNIIGKLLLAPLHEAS